MPYSYQRLVRKLFTNTTVKKIKNDELFQIKQDKILLIDYFVKFFVTCPFFAIKHHDRDRHSTHHRAHRSRDFRRRATRAAAGGSGCDQAGGLCA